MKNLKKIYIPSLFFITTLFLLLSNCSRYVYIDKKLSPQIEEILFLELDFHDRTSDQIQRVHYPSREFVYPFFMEGLLEEFNDNEHGIEISLWEDTTLQEKLIDEKKVTSFHFVHKDSPQALVIRKMSPPITSSQTFKKFGKLVYKKYGKWLKNEREGEKPVSHILSLDITMSAWEQDVVGFFTVRNLTGKVVWREELDFISPYIHNDSRTPYRSIHPKIEKKPIDYDSNHHQEMEKTFYQLGLRAGKALKITLNKIQNL